MARLLASVAIVTALLFAYSALRSRVEANWPALAWVPVAILLGTSRFRRASVAMAGALASVSDSSLPPCCTCSR